MTTDNYTMRMLRAEEGKFLTNIDAQDVSAKIITTEVYLAATDSPGRWVEITAEEADAIRAEQDRQLKAMEEERERQMEEERAMAAASHSSELPEPLSDSHLVDITDAAQDVVYVQTEPMPVEDDIEDIEDIEEVL